MLELRGVRAGYGRIEVLHGLDLTVGEGEIVTIIGANGAGKSTLLKAISGVVRISARLHHLRRRAHRHPGGGEHRLAATGADPRGPAAVRSADGGGEPGAGRVLAPAQGQPAVSERLEQVFALFPRLEERLGQQAGTLSGGEQQMLAVARALMAEPRLLLLDEPSMGLAPIVVRDIFTSLRRLNEEGLTMVLVEQDARIALSLAHRGLVMERGRIVLADTAQALLDEPGGAGHLLRPARAPGTDAGWRAHERDLEP